MQVYADPILSAAMPSEAINLATGYQTAFENVADQAIECTFKRCYYCSG